MMMLKRENVLTPSLLSQRGKHVEERGAEENPDATGGNKHAISYAANRDAKPQAQPK